MIDSTEAEKLAFEFLTKEWNVPLEERDWSESVFVNNYEVSSQKARGWSPKQFFARKV